MKFYRWRTDSGYVMYSVICPDCGLRHGWRVGMLARRFGGAVVDGTAEQYRQGQDGTCRCAFWFDLRPNDSEPNPPEV